jgi:molecular chaperone DnaK (HSP70)
MEPVVGIDLGTTNSEVAYVIDGNAVVMEDNDRGILPSCVGVDESGNVLVGEPARNQAVSAPERTVLSVKRRMGSDEKIRMGDAEYMPQEISAFILKALKARAERRIGRSVDRAVITVPAYFTDAQRQATREAGEIAGLAVARIINEPTAAALAYESQRKEPRRILVYDLGGGTFDVSIVRIEEGVVEVLSSTGDNQLGGDDFDDRIVDLLVNHCRNDLSLNLKPETDPTVFARLKRAAEAAKKTLSSEPYATIEEDHIGRRKFKDVHLTYELSRTLFEDLIRDDLDRTMESVNRALKDAALLPSAIDKIILVGGSTRIPLISKLLEEKFGQLPHSEIDPDLCVALGAAIQGGREMGIDAAGLLLDVTPYTFGTSALGEVDGEPSMSMFVPLIRRNTKLPTARTEAFYTVYDDQDAVEVKVFQGEEPDALDNIQIGKYHFELSRQPQGSVVTLHFDLDVNGILKIEAVEKATGKTLNATIENALSRFSDQEMAASRGRVQAMWGQGEAAEAGGTAEEPAAGMPADVSEMLGRAESLLDEASPEDRDEMVNLMEDIRESVRSGDPEAARKGMAELEEILFYIG